MNIANTPQAPYYAVIFTAIPTNDISGYAEMATHIRILAEQEPGFLGMESTGDDFEITVSYWESLEAIKNWKQNSEHLIAQKMGREKWYRQYKTRICKVERDYGFSI